MNERVADERRPRVVVTGMGFVTPIGHGADEVWSSLRDGHSGIGPITRFDTGRYSTRIAGEVRDFDPGAFMDKKEVRNYGRYIQYALVASLRAVDDAGIDLSRLPAEAAGVIIGTGIGGLEEMERGHRRLLELGPRGVSPFTVPMLLANMAPAVVAIRLRAGGPNYSLVSACASSCSAIGEAAEVIRRGHATAMLAGGAEAAITPLTMAGFDQVKALSARNDDPAGACRPFDRDRDGFVMSEGAVMVVLEAEEHALARGARMLGEVAGYGATSDMYHYVAPDPDGAAVSRVMSAAVCDAGLCPGDIGYVNAHATSTQAGDIAEVRAIRRFLGDRATGVPVSSTKSVTGHLMGGAGAMGVAAAILALVHQTLPPTINLGRPDEECDLDLVPNHARPAPLDVAMANSFGFGGHNASVVLRRVAP